MPVIYKCPRGHRWKGPDAPGAASACPKCGLSHSVSSAGPGSTVTGPDALPPKPTPAVSPVPGYKILSELGRGGMGVVYKARQLSLNRIVALKMLLKGSDARPQEAERFRSEAEAVARLQHPHIVQVHDTGEHQGRLFFSLEYMEGGSLRAKTAGRPQPPREAAALIETLARAAHHAHGRNVVHRDLKPANVLLTADGLPKIADFGLAKLLDATGQTADGAVFGTVSYMAPEQAEGRSRKVGPAADVWALGAMLYELLTGQPPFRGETLVSTIAKVLTMEPERPMRLNPKVPAPLETICLRCLRKNPAQRYPTAAALADDLHAFLAAPERRPTAPRIAVGTWLAAAGAVLTLLILLAAWVVWTRMTPAGPTGPTGPVGTPVAAGPPVMPIPVTLPVHTTAAAQPEPPSIHVGPPAEAQWEVFSIGAMDDEIFDRIAFPSREVGYAASRRRLHKTTDGGRTWAPVYTAPTPHGVHVLHFEDERTGWMSTDRLYHTDDGGQQWSPVQLPGEAEVRSLAFGPDGLLLAAGREGGDVVLFRRPAAGVVWEKIDPESYWGGPDQPYRHWYPGRVAVVAPDCFLLPLFEGSGDEGALLRSEDGGGHWQRVEFGPKDRQEFYDARSIASDIGWVAGADGALWEVANHGMKVGELPNSAGAPVSCLTFGPPGSGLGLAPVWKGQVLLFRVDKWSLEQLDLEYSTPDAAVVDHGRAFVLGSDGKVARYTDQTVPDVK